MTEQTFIKNVAAALSVLSPKERDQLGRMLHDPARRRAFQKLIESALRLSNGASVSDSAGEGPRGDATMSALPGADSESLRESFVAIFCDKKTFRTTKDVIDAAGYFFDAKIDLRRFVKAGRRETIAEAWRQVCSLPVRERSERLRRFFERFTRLLDPHRSYRELFRMLSRSE